MTDPVNPASSTDTPAKGLYATPDEALKKVSSEYEYWSGKLTETSLQMCYAIIGANWAVFGTVTGISHNIWSKLSLGMVMVALGSNVVAALRLSESLKKQMDYGEGNAEMWAYEFERSKGKNVAWPFTDAIQDTGKNMRWVKGGFAIAGAVFFLIGAALK